MFFFRFWNQKSDVITNKILTASQSGNSPSLFYFKNRAIIRQNCQVNWIYDPSNSDFCRRHISIQNLGRILVLVNQYYLRDPVLFDFELYRLNTYEGSRFYEHPLSTVTRRATFTTTDLLKQITTHNIMSLKMLHPTLRNASEQKVRHFFSNTLGIFITWMPARNPKDISQESMLKSKNSKERSCAVVSSIKMQMVMQICSDSDRIVSIVEYDGNLHFLLPSNRVVTISHDRIKRQFRIRNNPILELDSPEFDLSNAFNLFFRCPTNKYSDNEANQGTNSIRNKSNVIQAIGIPSIVTNKKIKQPHNIITMINRMTGSPDQNKNNIVTAGNEFDSTLKITEDSIKNTETKTEIEKRSKREVLSEKSCVLNTHKPSFIYLLVNDTYLFTAFIVCFTILTVCIALYIVGTFFHFHLFPIILNLFPFPPFFCSTFFLFGNFKLHYFFHTHRRHQKILNRKKTN